MNLLSKRLTTYDAAAAQASHRAPTTKLEETRKSEPGNSWHGPFGSMGYQQLAHHLPFVRGGHLTQTATPSFVARDDRHFVQRLTRQTNKKGAGLIPLFGGLQANRGGKSCQSLGFD